MQCANRLEKLQCEWRTKLSKSSPYLEQSEELFLQAIESVFADREMSPFMVDRLVKLCRAEFAGNVLWEHALEMVQSNCEDDMAYWKQTMNDEEKETIKSIEDLQTKIREKTMDLERMKARVKILDRRHRLQLTTVKQEEKQEVKVQEEESRWILSVNSDENHCSSFVTPISDDDDDMSERKTLGDWINVDDDYFQASSNGGWVLCS